MQRYLCMSEAVAETPVTDKVNLMLNLRERRIGIRIVEGERQ